jgi:MFS family permease
MFCSKCGVQSANADARFCTGCGTAFQTDSPAVDLGKHDAPAPAMPPMSPATVSDALPDGIQGWSWGAFLLNWIWAICNRTYIGLLALIPYVGFGVALWLGFKGRELAWKNGSWQSVEHFNRVQRRWSQWGVGLVIGSFALGILAAIAVPAYVAYTHHAQEKSAPGAVEATMSKETDDDAPGSASGAIDSNAEELKLPLRTLAGILSKVELPGGGQGLAVDGKTLFSGDDAQWHDPVHVFTLSGQREYILMASTGGNGNSCESLFYFLMTSPSGVRFTPEFGSCSPEGSYTQEGDTVTIKLPRADGRSSTIVFDGTTVIEDGETVKLNDNNDPSK